MVFSAGSVLNTGSSITTPPLEWSTGIPVGNNEGGCSRSYVKNNLLFV